MESKDAGVRSFDELKQNIRPLVLRNKKIDRAKEIAAEWRSKLAPGDSLTRLHQLDSVPQRADDRDIPLGGAIPGIGRDPDFIGAVSGLKPNEISPGGERETGAPT